MHGQFLNKHTPWVPLAVGRPVPGSRCHRPRTGFTLIELLITITIIGLLSAVVLGALQAARETAKAAKTKATITKLHYVIMARYDSYRTRRVPVNVRQYVASHSADFYPGGSWSYSQAYAHARLMHLRDLIRMEMPDRGSDLGGISVPPGGDDLTAVPSITERYYRLFGRRDAAAEVAALDVPSAEYLYMIVMAIPEAAEQFSNTEIGDRDGDGLPEFIDGWGHPIKILRWPVGFLPDNTTTPNGFLVEHGAITDLQDVDTPDPFDPTRVAGGYATFPLIYSAGPDGEYDINTGYLADKTDPTGYGYSLDANGNLDPYLPDGDGYLIGQPLRRDSDGTPEVPDSARLRHYDNIHNHMLEVR